MNLTTKSMTGILKHLIQIIRDNDLIKKKINPSATDISCFTSRYGSISLSHLCFSQYPFTNFCGSKSAIRCITSSFQISSLILVMTTACSALKNLLSVFTICLK